MAASVLNSFNYNTYTGYHGFSSADQLARQLVIISYNLHGLNQGKHGIDELILTIEPDFILLQEHWLTYS